MGEPSHRMAVVGAGTMGQSIARLFASGGHSVAIHDPFRAGEKLGGVPDPVSGSLRNAIADADVVFEAVPEDLALKRAIFSEIRAIRSDIWIASNTSTFVPRELFAELPGAERSLVVHFFNPADRVPLVEVALGDAGELADVEWLLQLLRDRSKVPVLVANPKSGFVANRLQAALIREALALVRDGTCEHHDVDVVIREGLGPRWSTMGPFATMDAGGLDIWKAVCERLFPELANDTAAPELVTLVSRGQLGRKTGEGFYAYH